MSTCFVLCDTRLLALRFRVVGNPFRDHLISVFRVLLFVASNFAGETGGIVEFVIFHILPQVDAEIGSQKPVYKLLEFYSFLDERLRLGLGPGADNRDVHSESPLSVSCLRRKAAVVDQSMKQGHGLLSVASFFA